MLFDLETMRNAEQSKGAVSHDIFISQRQPLCFDANVKNNISCIDLSSMDAYANFSYGFRLGALLMREILMENEMPEAQINT